VQLHPSTITGGWQWFWYLARHRPAGQRQKMRHQPINIPGGRPPARNCRGAATAASGAGRTEISARANAKREEPGELGRPRFAGPLPTAAQARDLPWQAPGQPTP
jgi:hypothetical protein